jgi:hypothetical protein
MSMSSDTPRDNLTLSEADLAACRPIVGEGGHVLRALCPFHGSDHQRSLRWSALRATRQARTASEMVSLAIGHVLQSSVQECPGLGVHQLNEDGPMAGLGQAPAAQDFSREFR